MNDTTALRLYFPLSAKAKAQSPRLWHRLSAPSLANHLLSYARRNGIKQAVLHHVNAGYLPGERLSHHHVEGNPHHHPQCLELIDTEEKLRKFLHDHSHELHKVHAVLYRCELPLER